MRRRHDLTYLSLFDRVFCEGFRVFNFFSRDAFDIIYDSPYLFTASSRSDVDVGGVVLSVLGAVWRRSTSEGAAVLRATECL